MIFDTIDFEFLKLCGLCRYIPVNQCKRYIFPTLSTEVITNLQEHGLIKMLSDGKSYKLTKRGRDTLAETNVILSKEARASINKNSYINKLKNAHLNIVLHVAGINVYYSSARELAGIDCGYMSSLMTRVETKTLSCAKFLGILKLAETAYIPYYIESDDTWVYPKFEAESIRSQVDDIKDVKDIRIVLVGETLEELWDITTKTAKKGINVKGQTPIGSALEEIGSEHLLIPLGREGVLQLKVMSAFRYRERIAESIGCVKCNISELPDCDGFVDKHPCIIALDFNVNRIERALKQIKRYNKNLVPMLWCFAFQKNTMFKLIQKYFKSKAYVLVIKRYDIEQIFTELKTDNGLVRTPVKTERGDYVVVPKKYDRKY